jgi:hypothetical protein
MNSNHQHQPSRRLRRSFGAAVAVVSLAAGVAACGDEDNNVVPSAAASNAQLKQQVQDYLDYQVGRAAAARQQSAEISDAHLEQHADEVVDRLAQRKAAQQQSAAYSDGHLQDKADEAAKKLDPSSRSRVKAV